MRTSIAVIALALAIPSPVLAARVAPRGKVRVHLDTEVFAWNQSRAPFDFGGPPPRTNTFGVGVGRPVTLDGALGTSVIALGVGYGVHRHLILGARVGVNFTRSSSGGSGDGYTAVTSYSVSRFAATFMPYLEILPLAEGVVLPYIMLRTGFSGGFEYERHTEYREDERAMSPLLGIGVGAHAFVARHFSLDFGVGFDHRWRYSTLFREASDGLTPDVDNGWHHTANNLTLAATLGLSTWF